MQDLSLKEVDLSLLHRLPKPNNGKDGLLLETRR